MSFTNLIFLFGTLAVIGPLLAHLWANPRYRRVPFTMIRFLQLGQEKNQSRQDIKNLLVLLLRCLIIVGIAMLFAGPQWLMQTPPIKKTTAYYIALDDSLSMAYRDGGKTYSDTMIQRAKQYLASASPEGAFNLYATASGKVLTNASRFEAEIFVKKLKINPGTANLTEFLNGVKNARTNNASPEKVKAFLASDFTPKMMETLSQIKMVAPVDEITYENISAADTINNLAITNAGAMLDSNDAVQINARIINYGQVDQQARMSVRMDGKVLCKIQSDLSAGTRWNPTCIVPLPKPLNQWLPLELHLENSDGLDEDNTFYLPIRVPEKKNLRIMIAGSDSREMFLITTALETLASEDTGETPSVNSLTFSQFKAAHLDNIDTLVFTGVDPSLKNIVKPLQTFVRRGGKIIYFAKKNLPDEIVKALLDAEILPVHPKTFHPEDLRLEPSPSTSNPALESDLTGQTLLNYRMDRIVFNGFFDSQPVSDSVCLWYFSNETGFMYRRPCGMGHIFWINTSADDSLGMLMKSPAAIPFCRFLLGKKVPLEENKILVGDPVIFPCSTHENRKQTVDILTPCGSKRTAAGSSSSFVLNCSDEIGFFKTLDAPVCYVGVNPNEGETNMEKNDPKILRTTIEKIFPILPPQKNVEVSIQEEQQYTSIWKYFAWIIIVLITAEAFITNRIQR